MIVYLLLMKLLWHERSSKKAFIFLCFSQKCVAVSRFFVIELAHDDCKEKSGQKTQIGMPLSFPAKKQT